MSFNFSKLLKKIISFPKLISIPINYLFLILLAIFEYFIRINFNLNVPGKLPILVGSGIIVYFIDSIKYFFSFLFLYKSLLKKKNPILIFGKIMLSLIIIQLPTVLIGQRGPLLHSFLTLFLFFIFILSTKNYKNYFKALDLKLNKIIFPFLLSIIIILITLGITNSIRTSQFEIFSFILRRITGIFDGLIFLNYFEYNPLFPDNSFLDFIRKLIFEIGPSPNKFYTINILGYPENAVHGSATPIFISSIYYGGFSGLAIISVYFGLFIGIINSVLKSFLLLLEKRPSIQLLGGVYFSLLLFVMIFHSNIIDGDISFWKFYSVPIFSFILVSLTKESKYLNYANN
jgi:hypothetical protein